MEAKVVASIGECDMAHASHTQREAHSIEPLGISTGWSPSFAARSSTILRPVASQGAASDCHSLRRSSGYVIANSSRAWLSSTESTGTHQRKTPHQAGFLSTLQQPLEINRYPGSCAAAPSGSGDAACAGPSLRSGGCARGSRRTACRPLPACGRCSCRCRSACAAPWLPSV